MPKRKRKEKTSLTVMPNKSKEGSTIIVKYLVVKYKGVYKSGNNKFNASISIDGKKQSHGTFDTPYEAAKAHDCAAIQAGCPPTKLNFPNQIPKDYKPKKKKLSSRNTIGYRGVEKNGNRFQARIRINGKRRSLGNFGTTKEAAIAWDLAAIQGKRPTSDLNFPDMIHVKKIGSKI